MTLSIPTLVRMSALWSRRIADNDLGVIRGVYTHDTLILRS